jgi:glycine/D-amino acid oxidase-like deaminating enzyme
MYKRNGATASLWMAATGTVRRPPVMRDMSCQVCVIGGGLAGLTTAYLLQRTGREVVIVDKGGIAGGESCRTTAHLSNAIDDRYIQIERLHGAEGARMAAESHTAAIDAIQNIVGRESIECDFERVNGYLIVPPGEAHQLLEDEAAAATRAGLAGLEMVERAPVPGIDTGPALKFPRQGQFDPTLYMMGLVRVFEANGGRIFGGTTVVGVESDSVAEVRTERGQIIRADAVVMATNTPVVDRLILHTKQASYRTYVIAGPLPYSTLPHALVWDTADPYHYVRVQAIGDGPIGSRQEMLIVGGEDHKSGQGDEGGERFDRLEEWARERYPMMGPVEHCWSGQVQESVDGLAFIGRNPLDADNIYVVTGDSGMGMTHGTIAGLLITDMIRGVENRWSQLYDPARKILRSLPALIPDRLRLGAGGGAGRGKAVAQQSLKRLDGRWTNSRA